MAWNVIDALNKNTQAAAVDNTPKARFRVKDISINKIYSNAKNFYSMPDIEQLMINDIRALRNDSVWLRKTMTETEGRRRSQIEELKKENKHIKLFAAIMICLYAAFRIVTNGKDKKQ